MGYTTLFTGTLKFTKELKASELAYLTKILGVDLREMPELERVGIVPELALESSQYSIDLKLTRDYSGLEWDGRQKSYVMESQVDFVISWMHQKYPDFGLEGHMNAQGEDVDDRWVLTIENNKAIKVETPPQGEKVQCPHCSGYFYLENKK